MLTEEIIWQPLSEIALVAGLIEGGLADTREHLSTLTSAREQPHVLDDATIDRVERVHTEQLEFIDIYAQQLRRWRNEGPSAAQLRELDRLEEQNRQLKAVTVDVIMLAAKLRKGTIDRILEMSDLELGLQAVLGTQPGRRG